MQAMQVTEELALVQGDDVERASSPSVHTSRHYRAPFITLGILLCVGVAVWGSHSYHPFYTPSSDASHLISAEANLSAMPGWEATTFALLRKFRVCTTCNHWERIGEWFDGGYLTCLDEAAHWPPKAIYSMGISTHDKWSVDLAARLNVSAYQFDCTVASAPQCVGCPNVPGLAQLIHFHRVCIAAEDHHQDPFPGMSWNLSYALEQTGNLNASENSLIMKMDIEGSEWPIFEAESREILSKFGTLIIEFHRFDFQYKFGQYLRAMEVLEGAGFRVAHSRGNNCCRTVHYGIDSIPMILEVTLIRRSGALNETECEQGYQRQSSLDHKNLPGGPNMGPAYLAE
jgi:hypothetical protein